MSKALKTIALYILSASLFVSRKKVNPIPETYYWPKVHYQAQLLQTVTPASESPIDLAEAFIAIA